MKGILCLVFLLITILLSAFDILPGETDTISFTYTTDTPVYVLSINITNTPENIDCIIDYYEGIESNQHLMNKNSRKALFEQERKMLNANIIIDTTILEKKITTSQVTYIIDRTPDIQKSGGKIEFTISDGFNVLDKKYYKISGPEIINTITGIDSLKKDSKEFSCMLSTDRKWYIQLPSVDNQERMTVKIYNVNGSLIRRVFDGPAKSTVLVWNGRDDYNQAVPSGMYFVQCLNTNISETKKIWYIK